MNEFQELDFIAQFNVVCKKLKESGADLSKIPITMKNGSKPSYITKRIMEEMGCQDD